MTIMIIGDLHLNSYSHEFLRSQIQLLDNIINETASYHIIFLGDIFHYRNPKSLEVIEFHKLLEKYPHKQFIILRGNHDTLERSDSNRTILEVLAKTNVKIITEAQELLGFYFIPHYESEETILSFLEEAEKFNPIGIIGHFGYKGLMSPEGFDYEGITTNSFKRPTILGHIHSHRQDGTITVAGVPYSTSFAESNAKHYFLQTDRWGAFLQVKEISKHFGGPAHYIISEEEVDQFDPHPNQLNFVRVLSRTMDTTKISKALINKPIRHFDILPVESKTKHSSYWKGEVKDLSKYVDECDTELDKNRLKLVIDEHIKLL